MVRVAHYRLLLVAEGDTVSVDTLAKGLGIRTNTVKKYLRLLEREGYVRAIDRNLYTLTDVGKTFRESLLKVRGSLSAKYVVTDPSSGQAIPLTFSNYLQLLIIYKYGIAPKEVLEEHFRRGYLIEWIKNVVGDQYLIKLINEGKVNDLGSLMNYIESVVNIIG